MIIVIDKILKKYNISGDVVSCERVGSCNINKSYLLIVDDKKYLIQQINNKVFTEPYKLMKNMNGTI